MPHFEVHTYARDRWLIDGIFSDKETAVDDAKLLMGRTRAFDAVRVLQVEEEPQGFQEWTVYVVARPRRRRWRRAAAAPAAPARRPATPAPLTRTHPPSAAPALLLLIALTLAGLLTLSLQRPSQPKWVWVFDRPEAWQTHELRNPWTGDVSR